MRRAPVWAVGLALTGLLAACDTTDWTPPWQAGDSEAAAGTEMAEADAGPADTPAEPPAGQDAAGNRSSGDAGPGEPDSPRASATPSLPSPGGDAAPPVPHIYLALQPGGTGHPVSAIFAIDAARDGNPSDDPAIRLTPEAGRCNPQEMRRYGFPPGASTPVVSEAEQARGLTARDLPRFLAAAVTGRLIDTGLATEPEDTRPLNVCTRKLWERLVIAENSDRLADRQ